MDGLEDGKTARGRAVFLNKCLLVGGRGVQGLVLVNLGRVVVSMQLLERAMLMSEHATLAVHALLAVIESPTVLRLEEGIVGLDGRLSQLFLPVSKTAIVFVAAFRSLNPVLAKLGFPLAVSVAWHWDHLDVLHAIGALLEAGVLVRGATRLIEEAHGLLLWRESWRERRTSRLESGARRHKGRSRCLDAGHKFAESRSEWVGLGAERALSGALGSLHAVIGNRPGTG